MERRHWRLVCVACVLTFIGPVADVPAQEPARVDVAAWSVLLASPAAEHRAAAIRAAGDLAGAAAPLLPRLVELLGDTEQARMENMTVPIRQHVIQSLRKIGPARDQALRAGLADKNRFVVHGVVIAMGELSDPAYLPDLIEQFNNPENEIASAASTAAVQIGEAAIEPLVAALDRDEVMVQAYSIAAMGKIRDPRVVAPVGKMLRDPEQRVREYAVYALQNLIGNGQLGTTWRRPAEIGESRPAVVARTEQDAQLKNLVQEELARALETGDEAVQLAALKCALLRVGPPMIPSLSKCVAEAGLPVRLQAIQVLGFIRHPDVTPVMIDCLDDPLPEVRQASAVSLSHSLTGRELSGYLPQLTAALDDDDPRVVVAVIAVWKQVDAKSRAAVEPRLLEFAAGENEEFAQAALETLSDGASEQAREPLFALLRHPTRQLPAAYALSQWRDPRAFGVLQAYAQLEEPRAIAGIGRARDRRGVGILIRLALTADDSLFNSIAQALGHIRDPRAVDMLIEALGNPNRENSAASALGDIRDARAIPPLLQTMQRQSNNLQFRFVEQEFAPSMDSVNGALVQFGPLVIEPAVELLASPDARVRQSAAYILDNLSPRYDLTAEDMAPAIEPLAKLLQDQVPGVRFQAALALGRLQDRRAVPVLVEAVARAHDRRGLYLNAGSYLARIKDERCVAPLIELLKHEEPRVRLAAARGLRPQDDPRSYEPLRAILNDPEAEVREAAVLNVGASQDPQGLEALRGRLHDESPNVRIAVASALGRLSGPGALEAIVQLTADPDIAVSSAAALQLAKLDDDRGVELIVRMLSDPDVAIRELAIVPRAYVARPTSPRLVEPLARALGDSSVRVRAGAASTLGFIRTDAAVAALLSAVEDSSMTREVLSALAETRDERAIPQLSRSLDHADPGIRSLAASRLATFAKPELVPILSAHVADPDPEVRAAVLKALWKIAPAAAAPHLRAATGDTDPFVSGYAKWVLRRGDQ